MTRAARVKAKLNKVDGVTASVNLCAERAHITISVQSPASCLVARASITVMSESANMTRDELLAQLAGLRQARVGQVRVPHKPLLLLWLFGQFAATGSSAASYQQAEEPVSQLINDFGPPVASSSAARQRAAMPFVHLERELWELRDATGKEIAPDAPERRAWLLERGAIGRLQAPVERLLADPGILAAATRLLLDTVDLPPGLSGYVLWPILRSLRRSPAICSRHADVTWA